ncbi:protein translocase subunit SecF [Paenibacillaceae bacterium]|nr:protein translocase subunit SecF [Paenibacillaceae bacterium]
MRYNFDFVKFSRYCFMVSSAIALIGILSLAIFGLNYGVDFRAGSNVDISVSKQLEKAEIDAYLDEKGFGNHQVVVGSDRITIRYDDVLTDVQENMIKTDFIERFDPEASAEVNTVDVEMARELQVNALLALTFASIGIALYICIRFEWRFALAAIIGLIHDGFLVIALFSIFHLEVSLTFIIAVLTIIGYSINDKIVIFDRIRENMRFAKIKSPSDLVSLVNQSIKETLNRSINTVLTVLFGAICLYIFGSESISMFSLAIVIGLVLGAYSSIFISAQLWLWFKGKEKSKKAVKAPAAS